MKKKNSDPFAIPKVWITACLTNCHVDCVASFEHSSLAAKEKGIVYGRGIINGLVTAFMVLEQMEFEEALQEVKNLISEDPTHGPFDARCIPNSWRDTWDSLD